MLFRYGNTPRTCKCYRSARALAHHHLGHRDWEVLDARQLQCLVESIVENYMRRISNKEWRDDSIVEDSSESKRTTRCTMQRQLSYALRSSLP